MLRTTTIAVVALAFAGCASSHHPKLRGNLFSELERGDRIHVQYSSIGCFHSFSYDFEFERGSTTTVRIASLQRRWSAARKAFEYHSPKPLGTLTLTPRDVSGLDRLVRFYRTHPRAGCTTADHITIEHSHRMLGPAAPPIATERYLDASCEADEISGVTTLSSLAERLEPKR